MRNIYGFREVTCVAAIHGLLQNSIATQSSSVVVKYDNESTYDFLQRTVGVHNGMKVSQDLSYGTYLIVRGMSTKVHKSGYGIQFGRDEYDVVACCVVSWKTTSGNYSTAHLYKLCDRIIDKGTFDSCVVS